MMFPVVWYYFVKTFIKEILIKRNKYKIIIIIEVSSQAHETMVINGWSLYLQFFTLLKFIVFKDVPAL